MTSLLSPSLVHKTIKVPAQQRGVGVGFAQGFGQGFGQGFDAGFGVGFGRETFGHGLGVMGSNCVTFTELEMFKKGDVESREFDAGLGRDVRRGLHSYETSLES